MPKRKTDQPKKEPSAEIKLGRPKLELTDKQMELAGELAGIGCNLKQIAHILKISQTTLDRRISEDEELSGALERGRAEASSKVLMAAYNMAISEKNPYMTTFWLRCKLGWSEPKTEQVPEEPFNMNYSRSDKVSGE